MRAFAEGRDDAASLLAHESRLCLGCRACETACPAGVEYGVLLEKTREMFVESGRHQDLARRFERALLRGLVSRPARLRKAMGLLFAVQRLRLDRMVQPLLPARWRETIRLAPRVPPRASRAALPARVPALGRRRGCVAFLQGCIMPEIFGDVNRASVELLSRNGFEVRIPPAQGCCGALQAHAGDMPTARRLARQNVRAFDDPEIEAIVVNSAGCGAAMREANRWLGSEGQVYADRVRDITEFLDAVGMAGPLQPIEARVCYDDPCHLVHAQGVAAAPRRLLAGIPGLELVEHADPSSCCGAAGTYNFTHPDMSKKVLDKKLDALIAAAPDLVASGNPGCLMQLASGLASRGQDIEAIHPVALLLRATPASG